MARGGVFGWAGLLLGHTKRLATATAREPSEVIAINTEKLVEVLEADRVAGGAVMERFATMIQQEFQVPDLLAQVRRLTGQPLHRGDVGARSHDVPAVALDRRVRGRT